VPLSLFATARRHWTWLRGAIERHCQFSREARLHRAKKNEGPCTPPGLLYSAHWQVTHSSRCGNRVFCIWQLCARDSGNKTAASAHGMGLGGLAVDAMAIGCLGVERCGGRFFVLSH